MRTCVRLGAVLLVLAMVAAGTSCRKNPEQIVKEAMEQSQALSAQGQTDAAVAVLRTAYETPACAGFRDRLLGPMLFLYLGSNRVDAAQSLFRELAARNVDEVAPAVGMIEERLFSAGRFEELAAWCAALQPLAFKEGQMAAIADYHIRALEAAGKPDDVIKVLPSYVQRLPEAAGLALLERQCGAFVRTKAFDKAEAVLAMIKGGAGSAARTGLYARLQVDLLIAQDRRAEAESFFKAQAAAVPEDAAVAMLRRLTDEAVRARQAADADALCRFVLDGIKDRPGFRNAAGELWIGTARSSGSVGPVAERLAALRKDGLPAAFILGQLDRHYGFIMDKAAKPEFGALLDMCQAMAGELSADEQGRIAGIMLDFCFYVERFDTALAIVEKGIPGRDEAWTKTLASKVRAHLLLQQGKPKEAVESFREFMGYIAKEEGDQIDPVKGTRVTKEMILGLNAKRIGDILAGAGDKDGAAAAYREARDYYDTAIKHFGEKTPEYAKLKDDIAAIPQAP